MSYSGPNKGNCAVRYEPVSGKKRILVLKQSHFQSDDVRSFIENDFLAMHIETRDQVNSYWRKNMYKGDGRKRVYYVIFGFGNAVFEQS